MIVVGMSMRKPGRPTGGVNGFTKMNGQTCKQIAIRFDADDFAMLSKAAFERKITMARLLRRLIKKGLENGGLDP